MENTCMATQTAKFDNLQILIFIRLAYNSDTHTPKLSSWQRPC